MKMNRVQFEMLVYKIFAYTLWVTYLLPAGLTIHLTIVWPWAIHSWMLSWELSRVSLLPHLSWRCTRVSLSWLTKSIELPGWSGWRPSRTVDIVHHLLWWRGHDILGLAAHLWLLSLRKVTHWWSGLARRRPRSSHWSGC